MSINRSTLTRGPAYAAYNSASFHFAGDSKIQITPVTQEVRAALYGKIDETVSDLAVKCTGTPLTWTSLATLFPYLAPTIGQRLFGDADKPLVWAASNGDLITLANAAVTRMPDLTLGVEKDILGPVEFTGLIVNNGDPESSGSYYTMATGNRSPPRPSMSPSSPASATPPPGVPSPASPVSRPRTPGPSATNSTSNP